jgi:hypothetical protein
MQQDNSLKHHGAAGPQDVSHAMQVVFNTARMHTSVDYKSATIPILQRSGLPFRLEHLPHEHADFLLATHGHTAAVVDLDCPAAQGQEELISR